MKEGVGRRAFSTRTAAVPKVTLEYNYYFSLICWDFGTTSTEELVSKSRVDEKKSRILFYQRVYGSPVLA